MTNSHESHAAWIIETSDKTFEQDVFERSKSRLVVVDFWAEWCQPCRMLAPMLEKLAEACEGKFVLVKAETEKVPKAAQEFQVHSIPAVFAVLGGEVIDFFQGVLPEEQLRGWIDRLMSASSLLEAQQLEESDPVAAEAKYRKFIEQSPNEASAQIGLARALLAQGRSDKAREVIESMEERGFLEPEAEKVKAQLELQALGGSNVDEARAAAEANPNDLDLQFHLAKALVGAEQHEQAFDIFLDLIQRDKAGIGEQAKSLMVDVFRILPDDSELVSTYRRKLSMVLY